MCAMMHGSSVFETVTTGISGHSAQDEPTAATIAKRFSALALSVISLPRSDSVAFGCEADMRTVDRSNQSDVNDPERKSRVPKCCDAHTVFPATLVASLVRPAAAPRRTQTTRSLRSPQLC